MKKIRLLAILLAMLMIPFSMFFACDNTEEPSDDDEEEEEGGGDDDTTPTRPIVTDNDGTNDEGGYLMYFHFNAAGNGMLNIVEPSTDVTTPESQYVLEAPYSTFLHGARVEGGSYVVRTIGDQSFLAIERVGTQMSPSLKIKVDETMSSDMNADHILQFDLYFENGFFGSPVKIYGTKNAGKASFTFLTIENGAMKDANGNVIYGEKAKDKSGWVTVSIAISEQTRTYNVFVDGINQTDGVAFPDDTEYPGWNSYKPDSYRIEITKANKVNTYVYIDDLSMKNGKDEDVWQGEDLKDVFTDEVPYFFNLFTPDKEAVLNQLVGTRPKNGEYFFDKGLNAMKSEIFSSKLLMSNVLTLSKITEAENDGEKDVIEDVMHDYGAEKGLYDEVSYFYKAGSDEYFSSWIAPVTGGEGYDSSNVQYVGKIAYDSNKYDATPAIEGTYTIGEGDVITFNWGSATAPQIGGASAIYAKYDAADSALTLYSDAACANAINGGVYSLYENTEPYANVKYSTVGTDDKLSFELSPFFGAAKLSVTPAEGEATEGVYPYTVNENTFTVTVDADTSYLFTYNDVENFFVYGADVILRKVVESVELASNERYAIKWSNFATGGADIFYLPIDTVWWSTEYQEYSKVVFEFYADEKLCADGFQFLLSFGCGNQESDGKEIYYAMTFDSNEDFETELGKCRYEPGWNCLEFDLIRDFSLERTPSPEMIQSAKLTVRAWENGPDNDANGANTLDDGYNIYIGKLAFVKNTEVEVQGPDEQHAKCTHEKKGVSLWEDVAEPIEATCKYGEYYIQRCSECGATRYDPTKPVGDPIDHRLDKTNVRTVNSSCVSNGYQYYECIDCGYHHKLKILYATGHTLEVTADWTRGKVKTFCAPCGYTYERTFYDALIPMTEKIYTPGFEKYFVVDKENEINTNINFTATTSGSNFNKSGMVSGIVGPMRHATIKSVEVAGRAALELTLDMYTPVSGDSNHCYFSPSLGTRSLDFVFETEIMLGAKKANGKYLSQSLAVCDRSREDEDGSNRDFTIYSISEDGLLTLKCITGTAPTYQLSDTEFTNVAVAFTASTNTVSLYIDGRIVGEPMPFKGHALHVNAADVLFDSLRYNIQSANNNPQTVAGGSLYFSGMGWYEASEPICIITDNLSDVVETTGEIKLKDDEGYDLYDSFIVDRIDVNGSLAVNEYTTKYVMDFTLNGTELADGTILEGIKLGTGYNRYEALLSVKNGKLYCIDREISLTTENVRIAIAIDDTIGAITVYVNGVEIEGTISYSNPEYKDVLNASFRGITFRNDCGKYTVSGFEMYTGSYKA